MSLASSLREGGRRIGRLLSRVVLFLFIVCLAVLPIPLPPFLMRRLLPKRDEHGEVLREHRD